MLNNASGLIPGDGQFSETVLVYGGIGPYTVLSSSNIFTLASPAPPGAPIPVPNGTPLVPFANKDSANINFKIVDALPWTMTVEDSIGQLFTIGNVCSYPTAPVVSGNVVVCQNTSPAPDLTTYVTGANLKWYSAQTGGTGSNSAPIVNTAIAGTNTYYVSQDPGPGCESPRSAITVTVNPAPVVVMSSTVVTCFGGNDGSATVTASGGTGALTILWNTFASTSTISGLIAGTYSVTVTDANGCTTTATVAVTSNPQVVVTPTATPAAVCEGSSSTIDATGAVTYSWMPGPLSGASVSVTPAATTTYTVTGSDANNCTGTATITVTVDPIATVNAGADITLCGCCGALASLNGTIGGSATSATWTIVPNPADANYLGTGTLTNPTSLSTAEYTPSAADAGHVVAIQLTTNDPAGVCDAVSDIMLITVNECPDITTTNDTICAPGAASYDLLTRVTNVNAIPATTTFHATLADAQGNTGALTNPLAIAATTKFYVRRATSTIPVCKDIDSILVVVLTPVTVTATPDTFICNGSSVVLHAITAGGMPNPAYTYAWSPALGLSSTTSSAPTATPTVTTIYTVLVTDRNGCTATDDVTITVSAAINIAHTQTDSICVGSNAGIININVTGGIAPYSYLWNGTITTQNLSGLVAGTYTVVVTDNIGCTKSLTVVIYERVCTTIFDPCICLDNASGLVPGDGQFSETVSVVGGIKPYTVTSSTGVYDFTLSPAPPAPPVPLANGTVLSSTAKPDSAYITFKTVDAEPYSITITDSVGQVFTIGNTCFYPLPPVVTSPVSVCQNTPDVTLSTLVTSGTNLTWYDVQTGGVGTTNSPVVSTAMAGTFTFYVSQDPAPLCESPRSEVTVVVLEAPMLAGNSGSVSCNGGVDGYITLSSTLGTGPYDYTIVPNPNGQSFTDENGTVVFNNLPAGTYTVTVTDANGCTATGIYIVLEPSQLDKTVTLAQPLCPGGTGSVTVVATGGTPWLGIVHPAGYEYSIDGGTVQFTGVFTGIVAGIHTVTIQDSLGCITTAVFTIVAPSAFICDGNVINVTCPGGNDGSITTNISGGTGAYTYVWSHNALLNSPNATGLSAGTYTVTVTDANGCTHSCSYTVMNKTFWSATMSVCQPISCNGGTNGSVCITNVLGGTPWSGNGPHTELYNYTWNTLPVQTTSSATGLAAGTYSVLVQDSLGCDTTFTITLGQPTAITFTQNCVNSTCFGANNGQVQITGIAGGTPGLAPNQYTITFTPGGIQTGTSATISNLAPGVYTFTIADANGCTATGSCTITQPADINIAGVVTNVSCNGGANGSINVTTTGGPSGTYTYVWNNGTSNFATTEDVSGLSAGAYTVTVTDGLCTKSASFTVVQPMALGCVCPGSITNVSCFGGNNGSITVTPTGGTAPIPMHGVRGAPLKPFRVS
nr:SprB repeat-containing protein [Bacteroidota bacterium]